MLLSKKISLLLTVTLFYSFFLNSATAQSITVNGGLKGEKGEDVIGATIRIKGTDIVSVSDLSGNFTVKTTKLTATLQFFAVGYEQTEWKIKLKGSKDSIVNLTITLKESSSSLSDVVVVGYSTSDDGYADRAEAFKYAAPAKVFAGKASGVAVSPTPAGTTIRIRGAASIGTTTTETGYREEAKKASFDTTAAKPAAKRTSKLTAGEVNDFKKWKMWEDYNESDFKTHSEKWALFATQRYSVQLQNNDFRAITGQTIYLIGKASGDTLWTAVSDNTGKAELWQGFNKKATENDLLIAVKNEARQFAAIPFAQGINRIIINKTCAVSNKVEIAFVVDATGSMQDEIDYLKEELEDILTKISVKDPTLDLHTGAVFYRDKSDEYVTRVQPMAAGISNTITFIKKQVAGGGGDYPEALKEGLQDAVEKLSWSTDARTKIIFLLMDAPPHDEAKAEMLQLIRDAAAKGIRIVPVACSGTDKATEFIMRSMALATNGTYLFLTDDSGIGNGHIKPTTDEFKVELLNDLLQRIIEQMCYVNTCEVKTTGIEPLAVYTNTGKVTIYPNPSAGMITLQTSNELKEIFVADFTGKILMRIEVKDKKEKYSIDLSAFPSATYFIRYITKENTSGAEKVVLIR